MKLPGDDCTLMMSAKINIQIALNEQQVFSHPKQNMQVKHSFEV